MRSERYGDPEKPECENCGKRGDRPTYCEFCNENFCEECSRNHFHTCEDCGGSGEDSGALYEPEVCKECNGSKLGESLYERSKRRDLLMYKLGCVCEEAR